MRLRTFTGRTTTEAMALVREHLGPEAIIVSTQAERDGGMRVTAALDQGDLLPALPASQGDVMDTIGDALSSHGVAAPIVEKILTVTASFDEEDPLVCLSGALAALHGFAPVALTERPGALLLAGPPGVGKTVTVAKLAARAVLAGHRVRLISTDTARAGGIHQLASFATILKAPLDAVDGPDKLATALAAADPAELVLVDTGGVNPYNAGDRDELATLIAAGEVEPILVLSAGGDVVDTTELAHAFQALGCNRMVVTRMDMVHRLGSVLMAADTLQMAFCEAGIAGSIADGLTPFTPVFLARLLLPQAAQARRSSSGHRGFHE